MAAFFTDVLDEFLTPAFLEKVKQKYHFGSSQMTQLREMAEEMLPLLRGEAFWERKVCSVQDKYLSGLLKLQEKCFHKYEMIVMSLGSEIDDLQEKYSKRELLLQSYMIEVLADEVLMQGYAAYEQYIAEKTGWHIAKYHFPGSGEDFPMDLLPELLKDFSPRITCNPYFYMIPAKSVAFVSELTREGAIQCRSICVDCTDLHCPNREPEGK